MPRTKTKPQVSMDDHIYDDPELLRWLDNREELKEYLRQYRQADKKAKERIRTIEAPTPFRVGPYVIDLKKSPGHSVWFETQESARITITNSSKMRAAQ
jgi:hypothetical protein